MRIITCFGSDNKQGLRSLLLSRSLGLITSWIECFQQYSLTVAFLHYFFIMPVRFILNVTYGLNPQVSSIRMVTVFRRSIFQLWVTIPQGQHHFSSAQTKLSPVRWRSHLDEWPTTNTTCCNNFFFFHSLSKAILKTAELTSLVWCRSFYFSAIRSSFRHVHIRMYIYSIVQSSK